MNKVHIFVLVLGVSVLVSMVSSAEALSVSSFTAYPSVHLKYTDRVCMSTDRLDADYASKVSLDYDFKGKSNQDF